MARTHQSVESSGQRALTLTSPAFSHESDIPTRYTCDGDDISPALAWGTPPNGTLTWALIVDDPDAPGRTWVHWVLFDLPAKVRALAEGQSGDDELPSGARQGRNDFKKIGYGGPCPPAGPAHRYFFKLFALDTRLDLPAGATAHQVEQAMRGHVLADATLMGRYARR